MKYVLTLVACVGVYFLLAQPENQQYLLFMYHDVQDQVAREINQKKGELQANEQRRNMVDWLNRYVIHQKELCAGDTSGRVIDMGPEFWNDKVRCAK